MRKSFVTIDLSTSKIETIGLDGNNNPSQDYIFSDDLDCLVYSTYPRFYDIDGENEFLEKKTMGELYAFTPLKGSLLLDQALVQRFEPFFYNQHVYYMKNGNRYNKKIIP